MFITMISYKMVIASHFLVMKVYILTKEFLRRIDALNLDYTQVTIQDMENCSIWYGLSHTIYITNKCGVINNLETSL